MLNRIDKVLGYLDQLKSSLNTDDQKEYMLDDTNNEPNNNNNNNNNNNFNPIKNSLSDKILSKLNSMNIKYKSISHKQVLTSDEHFKVIGNNINDGVLVKNLLVKEKRQKIPYCVVYDAKKSNIDLKLLGKKLGVGGGLRMERDSIAVMQMEKGCITPLACLFNDDNKVKVLCDDDLINAKSILVHPGTNTATISIAPTDLKNYVESCGNKFEFYNLNQFIGDAAKATAIKIKKDLANNQPNKPINIKPQHQVIDHSSAQEGITYDKYTQFGEWYKELVTKCELIDYSDIKGCYILRPLSYYIWEQIQKYMDAEIKKLGVSNCYFPLFVSEDALRAESKHFDDFQPEVAWVTHSGNTKLEKRIAVRPTSETIMYPMFSKWIRSFRDLPFKINQWCNVVRWEFKNATPFIRTREFLWQEGHTAHANQESADKEVYDVLDIYARTYENICAIPVVKGIKTKNETFPGADYTTTVECYVASSGRGCQGATSHCLGKNFSKKEMFNIVFEDEEHNKKLVIQNSWGFTTRSIGVMIMNHSDNKGLILPPNCAQYQVVIIPIIFKSKEKEIIDLKNQCLNIKNSLIENGVRCFIDDRDSKNPGYKFNEWELKGIPIRMEIGPRDMKNKTVFCARRDLRDNNDKLAKVMIKWDNIVNSVKGLLKNIHINLYNKAKKELDNNIVKVTKWDDFLNALSNGKLVLAPSCNESKWEDEISVKTKEYFQDKPDTTGSGMSGKAKALCIPLESTGYQPKIINEKCIISGNPAKKWILFGRSY